MKIAANLGYLWTELELCDAIRQAQRYGFDAVEFHWPYITHALDVALTLEELGVPLVCLNTVAGDLPAGEFGLAALPGREQQARAAIDKAFAYAADSSASAIHVLAGVAEGKQAADTYLANLRYAADQGEAYGVGVLIEPISSHARPGYFLRTVNQAADVIDQLPTDNVSIMFDCFHAVHEGYELLTTIERFLPRIGHIQFSSIPDRSEPDHGDVNYAALIPAVVDLGYDGFFGAEYMPSTTTIDGLSWLEDMKG